VGWRRFVDDIDSSLYCTTYLFRPNAADVMA
jgi:hypothetical protein